MKILLKLAVISLITLSLTGAGCTGGSLDSRSLEDRLEDALAFEDEEEMDESMPLVVQNEDSVALIQSIQSPEMVMAEQQFMFVLMVKGPGALSARYLRVAIEGMEDKHVRIPMRDSMRAPWSGFIAIPCKLGLDRKLFDQTFTLHLGLENSEGEMGPTFPVVLRVGAGSCTEQAETCDLVDNNCDGTVDEGFSGLYEACTDGSDECPVDGLMACAEDGQSLACWSDQAMAEGDMCQDGDDCTYDDVCLISGTCAGTAITCQDDPTTCGALRSCNGTDQCDETFPAAGLDCNDGFFCTTNDTCDGAGTCVGGMDDPCQVRETCYEDEDQCCEGNASLVCDAADDLYWQDTCGHLGELVQDCSVNSTCDAIEGVCSCNAGWAGLGCDRVEDCAGYPDFTKCDDGDPTRQYDICVNQACVSPGCGFLMCNTPGAHFPIPDTNLRVCTDTVTEADCVASGQMLFGQDAQYGWDMNHQSAERFIIADPAGTGDLVVEDTITGLHWQQVFATANFASGLAACDGSIHGGYDDWHLPSVGELFTLMTADPINPNIDPNAFPNMPSNMFMTIEATGIGTDEFWAIDFRSGTVVSAIPFTDYAYRCVRGGATNPAGGRYTSSDPNGLDQFIVSDGATGLTWMTDPNVTAQGNYAPWWQALGGCEMSTWSGFDDWRLPNIQELMSLVDRRQSFGVIDTDSFNLMPEGAMWSSTFDKSDPMRILAMDSQDANLTSQSTADNYRGVICVRGFSAL